MNTFLNIKKYTSILVTVLGIFVAILVNPLPAQAAVDAVVNGGSGTNAQRQVVTLNSQIRNYLQQLVAKEYNLDPAASASAKRAAVQYYEEMRDFLASGNAGEAFFVDNLELYRAGIRSTTTINVIEELSTSNMCGAFKQEVLTALVETYKAENTQTVAQKNTCALEEATDNPEAFLKGEFDIQALFAVIRNPGDTTPIGSFVKNDRLAREQADEAEENAMEQFRAGQGFIPQYGRGDDVMVCTKDEQNGIRDNCRIATPATAIRERVAAMLAVELKIKTDVDEYQEDVIARVVDPSYQRNIVTGLTGQAFNPLQPQAQGTTSTSTGPLSDDPFPQIPNEITNPTTLAFLAQVTLRVEDTPASSTNPIRPVLVRTLTKMQYQLQMIRVIDKAEVDVASTTAKYAQYSCYNQTIPNTFENERILTTTETPFTIDAIKRLFFLFLAYEDALANNSATTQTILDFQELMRTNFAIPTEVDLDGIEYKFEEFVSGTLNAFYTERQRQITACELIINPPENANNNNRETR